MEVCQFGLAPSILEDIWAHQSKCFPMQPIKATPRQHFSASESFQLLPACHSSHWSLLTLLLLELLYPGNLKYFSHIDHPQALMTSNCSLHHQVKKSHANVALIAAQIFLPLALLWFEALRQTGIMHHTTLSSYRLSLSLPIALLLSANAQG